MNKSFVFTDVHGCGKELEKLISEYHDYDLYSLGDNFDRAFDGVKVYEILKKYNVQCILGNHEHKMLEYLEGRRSWLPKHYYYFLHEFTKKYKISELIDFIKNMKLLIPLDRYILTHGGINLEDPYKEDLSANTYGRFNPSEPMPAYSDKETDWWNIYDGDPVVIYGHIVHKSPLIKRNSRDQINSIGLDTGACHGGLLTGLSIDSSEPSIYQRCVSKDYYNQMKKLDVKPFVLK
jgi:serine/threonine protein phosphatase 1